MQGIIRLIEASKTLLLTSALLSRRVIGELLQRDIYWYLIAGKIDILEGLDAIDKPENAADRSTGLY